MSGLRVIADRLGHTSVRTVLDVCGHRFDGTDEATTNRLDNAFRKADVVKMSTEAPGEVATLRAN